MASTRLPNINRIVIVGNLTKDPELRSTTTGVPVVNFRIAANRRFKDSQGEWKEDVCYVGVVAWQKLAESCASKLRKGSAVYIEGELRSRTIDGEDGTRWSMVEIRAHHIQFLDKSDKLEGDISELNELYIDNDEEDFK